MAGKRAPQVDLERLAAGYASRAEKGAIERARQAAESAQLGRGSKALDVGGGKGAHAAAFQETGAVSCVVDAAPAMAAAAQSSGVPAVVGDGGALPFSDSAFDLCYFHLSIHHGDAKRWLDEACRVVVSGGVVWLWTLADEHLEDSFLGKWFPSVTVIDRARFPPVASLAALMEEAGLVNTATGKRTETIRRTAGSWVEAVRAGFVSSLHLVDPDEIEEGLERFRGAHPSPTEVVEYRLRYAWVSGIRPSLRS